MSRAKSPSLIEWERQNVQFAYPAIDTLMQLVGLENFKEHVLAIKNKVNVSTGQSTNLKTERFGVLLQGNPGTGKTLIGRLYGQILISLGIVPGQGFVETTGAHLAHGGIPKAEDDLAELASRGGGVYFIDDSHQMLQDHNSGGKAVIDFLLSQTETLTGHTVFIFAGPENAIEAFLQHDNGFSGRVPYSFHFPDFTETELLYIFQDKIQKIFNVTPLASSSTSAALRALPNPSQFQIDGGINGVGIRILIQRLAKGRGKSGFGNARQVENLLANVRSRQAARLQKFPGSNPFAIILEDLIGPNPAIALPESEALPKLERMIGLKAVKQAVKSMISIMEINYHRELNQEPLLDLPLNRIFYGNPGTGKTTVAKLYGQILVDFGLLSKGQVTIKNPSDLVSNVLGGSESNTKGILNAAEGNVLVIDEAHGLDPTAGSSGGQKDHFRKAVIDTIVAEVQGVPGEDRCVLLLGYKEEMVNMFQNADPGLKRRFNYDDPFYFEDFTDAELEQILRLKLKDQGFGATDPAISAAMENLKRGRAGLHFGNAGAVENLISKAKINYLARVQNASTTPPRQLTGTGGQSSPLQVLSRTYYPRKHSRHSSSRQSSSVQQPKPVMKMLFEPEDFDPDFERSSSAEQNLHDLFEGVVGCDKIIEQFENYMQIAKTRRELNEEPHSLTPMSFVFKGPPGTGKTTTARKIGQIFFDLGILSDNEVVECSAADLIAQFSGQTAPKTRKQFERGLGHVLFIDEAYRLAQSPFGQEAIDEMVYLITTPKFSRRMIVILAGYDHQINRLLAMNPGMGRRFPDEVKFSTLSPEDCIRILEQRLKATKVTILGLNVPHAREEISDLITELSRMKAWGNAGDIEVLANTMSAGAYLRYPVTKNLVLTTEDAKTSLQDMLAVRREKEADNPDQSAAEALVNGLLQPQAANSELRANPPNIQTRTSNAGGSQTNLATGQRTATGSAPGSSDEDGSTSRHSVRDAGVSDAVWFQLQADKASAKMAADTRDRKIVMSENALKTASIIERLASEELADTYTAMESVESNPNAPEHQLYLAASSEYQAACKNQDKAKQELDAAKKAVEDAKKEHDAAQEKLKIMGVCPMGFQWIKQRGGWRCAGGSHYMSDDKVGM